MDYYDEFGEECNNEIPEVPWEETLYGCDFRVVTEEYGGDWDWNVTTVWYSPSRDKYYKGFDAGCSCNSAWDRNMPISDFEVGSREEIIRSLDLEMASKVRDFDPTKEEEEEW